MKDVQLFASKHLIDSLCFPFPLTQPASHLSVTPASSILFSWLHLFNSGIHAGAIDLERAVVGDSRKGI